MPSEKKQIETIDVYWETNFFMSGIVWTWGRMGGEGGEGGTRAAALARGIIVSPQLQWP